MTEPEYTGKDVSYYLVDVKTPKRLDPYTAECEDIIEALGMTFAEGCAFKAIWRKCAARTLGVAKSGYKGGLYDAEKTQYYGGRMVAAEERLLLPEQAPTPHYCGYCAVPEGVMHHAQCPLVAPATVVEEPRLPEPLRSDFVEALANMESAPKDDPVWEAAVSGRCPACGVALLQQHEAGCPVGSPLEPAAEIVAVDECSPIAPSAVCPGCGRPQGHRHRRGCTTRWPELAESAPKDDPFAGAPDWAKYKAQDADGRWFWYENSPIPSSGEAAWRRVGGLTMYTDESGEPNPNWRETLIVRPTK